MFEGLFEESERDSRRGITAFESQLGSGAERSVLVGESGEG